jgi:hypothetical protein
MECCCKYLARRRPAGPAPMMAIEGEDGFATVVVILEMASLSEAAEFVYV